jgi:ABC-type amino acid transport substrate-binding protein
MIRFLVILAALWTGVAAASSGETATSEVRIGMRVDAPPFVHRTPDGRFEGFLADICRRAVETAGYARFSEHAINAQTRLLAGADGAPEHDVICDPTTLTLARAGRMDFSPIVFIANATFAARDTPYFLTEAEAAASQSCKAAQESGRPVAAAGMVAGTTAVDAFQRALRRGVFDRQDHAVCAIELGSHTEIAERYCSGDISYYFADADILRAAVRSQEGCRPNLHSSFLTYEPYALMLPSTNAEFRRRFNRAIYELFTGGFVEKTYEVHFGSLQRSPALDTLFSINSIPRGEARAE